MNSLAGWGCRMLNLASEGVETKATMSRRKESAFIIFSFRLEEESNSNWKKKNLIFMAVKTKRTNPSLYIKCILLL